MKLYSSKNLYFVNIGLKSIWLKSANDLEHFLNSEPKCILQVIALQKMT